MTVRCARRRSRTVATLAVGTAIALCVVAQQITGTPRSLNATATIDGRYRPNPSSKFGGETYWFGKNHNTPEFTATQAGPFDQWPTGMGFEYFYGFVGGNDAV